VSPPDIFKTALQATSRLTFPLYRTRKQVTPLTALPSAPVLLACCRVAKTLPPSVMLAESSLALVLLPRRDVLLATTTTRVSCLASLLTRDGC
jgi:hypothetical protein